MLRSDLNQNETGLSAATERLQVWIDSNQIRWFSMLRKDSNAFEGNELDVFFGTENICDLHASRIELRNAYSLLLSSSEKWFWIMKIISHFSRRMRTNNSICFSYFLLLFPYLFVQRFVGLQIQLLLLSGVQSIVSLLIMFFVRKSWAAQSRLRSRAKRDINQNNTLWWDVPKQWLYMWMV